MVMSRTLSQAKAEPDSWTRVTTTRRCTPCCSRKMPSADVSSLWSTVTGAYWPVGASSQSWNQARMSQRGYASAAAFFFSDALRRSPTDEMADSCECSDSLVLAIGVAGLMEGGGGV